MKSSEEIEQESEDATKKKPEEKPEETKDAFLFSDLKNQLLKGFGKEEEAPAKESKPTPAQTPMQTAPGETIPEITPPTEQFNIRNKKEHYEMVYKQGISIINSIYFPKDDPSPYLKNLLELTDGLMKSPDTLNELLLLGSYPHYLNKDDYLSQKALNVYILAMDFAEYLKEIVDINTKDLAFSAALYKIGLSSMKSILNTKGQISETQRIALKKHPDIGSKRIKSMVFPKGVVKDTVLKAVSEAYEELDGTGYPRGIKDPNLYSRIIRLLDKYEAITHTRGSRQHYNLPNEAFTKMIELKNDPKSDKTIITHLIENCGGVYPIGAYVQLSSEDIGRVFRANRKIQLRPLVKILYENDSGTLVRPHEEKIINLALDSLLTITKALKFEELPEKERKLYASK